MRGESIIRFVKEWTLPVAMTVGTVVYLVFYYVPQLDAAGDRLGPVLDVLMPVMVFLTLLITFCKVDFHQMRLHRWHLGVLTAQLLLVALNVGIIFYMEDDPQQKLLWEAVLTCIIGPSAAAAPVVVGKLGGNISTMTTYTLISAFLSALLIPVVFPLLEQTVHVDFLTALLIILEKVSMVLLLPLALGWLIQHYVEPLRRWVVSQPNLSFYSWAVSLSITTGITVKNIVHSQSSVLLLLLIAVATLVLCFVQFIIGRGIGRWLGERLRVGNGTSGIEVNAGQALFQKNTGLSIWVAYMYLSPVASIGAGCYVLWQNIINSVEIWLYQRKNTMKCL